MAQIAHGHARVDGETLTLTDGWAAVVTLDSGGTWTNDSDWVANAKYLVLVTSQIGSDSPVIVPSGWRVTKGGTAIADSVMQTGTESTGSPSLTYFWWGIVDQGGTTEDIAFEHNPDPVGGHTAFNVRTTNPEILAIRLDDDLTQGTHWDIDTHDDSASPVDPGALPSAYDVTATEAFTPASTGDYLYLAMARYIMDAGSRAMKTKLQAGATGSEADVWEVSAGDNADQIDSFIAGEDEHVRAWAYVETGVPASGRTVRLACINESSGTANLHYLSRVMWIRLDAFEDHQSSFTSGSVAIGTAYSDTDNPIAEIDTTPTTTGDQVIFASYHMDPGGSGHTYYHRIQVDGTTHEGPDELARSWMNGSGGDEPIPAFFTIKSVATTDGGDTELDVHQSSGNDNYHSRFIAAFSTELAAAAAATAVQDIIGGGVIPFER